MDLDTFPVALYNIVDNLYQANIAPLLPVRCGPKPRLSDREMLTLALCAQWRGASERAFLRYAAQRRCSYFPGLTTQSTCNRRIRKLAWVLAALAQEAARELAAHAAPFQVVDTVPLPLMRRCRGQKYKLFGAEADIGRGGADRDWYYGCCKLMLAATNQGVITGFFRSPASTEGHWAAEAFFCCWADPLGTPLSPQEMPLRRNGQKHVGLKGPQWPQYGPGGRRQCHTWGTTASSGLDGNRAGYASMERRCWRPAITAGRGRNTGEAGTARGCRWWRRSTGRWSRSSTCISPRPAACGSC